MTVDKQALKLLKELWSDFQDPLFIWQVVALVSCLMLAGMAARWWWRRTGDVTRGEKLSGRLVFPLTAVLLLVVVRAALHPFMHINLLSLALPLLGSMAVVRAILHALRHAFPQAEWLAGSERFLALVVWGSMALYITDLAPYVIDALESVSFRAGKQQVNLWMILNGGAVVVVTVLAAMWLAHLLEQRLMGAEHLDSSLRIVLVRVSRAVLTVVALLFAMTLVGIDITALSVFTGALGVGLGLGLQRIASNYVSGFIILLDRSIRLGNVIQVDANTSGIVSQITTRYTVLSHPSGVDYLVPNEALIGTTVQNQSFSTTRQRLSTTVGVAYDCDLEQVMALMESVAAAHPRVLSEPRPKALVVAFADSAINLELGFWIEDPENGTGNVRSDVNLALWKAFRDQGIAIPFPQREVRVVGGELPGA